MTAVPGRLLVVDDDVHIRRLIKVFLRDAQYELAEAATGEEALQLARRQAFDVVLVDLILPNYGGSRLCQKLDLHRRADLVRYALQTGILAPESLAATGSEPPRRR